MQLLTACMFVLFIQGTIAAQTANSRFVEQLILPSLTDDAITNVDVPHLVMYDEAAPKGKLFLFIPGTHGVPDRGPKDLFRTAIEQGYRVINISYINTPAVAQICRGENLEADCDCTDKFRTKRIYGDNTTPLIDDEVQDAIIPRLKKLLVYLNEQHPNDDWGMYLKDGDLRWDLITFAGQSQGGGMSAFIAKDHVVNRVVNFSGGWDYSAKGEIAHWYSKPCATPLDRLYGTYHAKEPAAPVIAKTYEALQIPEDHIFALDRPFEEGKKAHTRGVRDVVYKPLWIKMIGSGSVDVE